MPVEKFFDLQVNGFKGVDFQQDDLTPAELEGALVALQVRHTRILYTLITDGVDRLCARLERVESIRGRSVVAREVIAVYYLDGPYLQPAEGYHGAHDPERMKAPEIAEFDRCWAASGGNLRLITLAPEWPGTPEFIRHAVRHGVRISVGHSNAGEAALDEAFAAGLTHCTHLGNAVPVQLPRHDNIIQRLLARAELYAAFIPDGVHLSPSVLRNFVRAKPREKVLFATDGMAAAGAPVGRYRLGRLETVVESGPWRFTVAVWSPLPAATAGYGVRTDEDRSRGPARVVRVFCQRRVFLEALRLGAGASNVSGWRMQLHERKILEMESLGLLTILNQGQSIEHRERWSCTTRRISTPSSLTRRSLNSSARCSEVNPYSCYD